LTGNAEACLDIRTGGLVDIDLAGFSITSGGGANVTFGILATPAAEKINVLNGLVSGFTIGLQLTPFTEASIVEGLHVSGTGNNSGDGISARGIIKDNIVKDNIVSGFRNGIAAGESVVIHNSAYGNSTGISVAGVVIGNIANANSRFGISVACPSNVTNNTAVNNSVANTRCAARAATIRITWRLKRLTGGHPADDRSAVLFVSSGLWILGMNLDLTEEEAAALLRELDNIIANDRYFLSPRITRLKAIRSKIRPEPEREPLPPLKHYEPPRAGPTQR
jgi:hypothetical protein